MPQCPGCLRVEQRLRSDPRTGYKLVMRYEKRLVREVGRRVAIRRKRSGMTQDQFARKLGVTDAHISYLERGERGPSLVMLHKIAAVLGTTVGRLVPDKV